MKKAKNLVMVVEDERPLLTAIQKKLERSGFETITARSGEQALDYLKSLDETPNLIWLDYYLQGMNGIELLKVLKKSPNWKNIPVFVVSNTAGPDKIEKMKELGIKRHYIKAEKRLDNIIEDINKLLKGGEV